jgi:hypothetical protein
MTTSNHKRRTRRTTTRTTRTEGRPFKKKTMIYKRFKTYVLEYISEHDVLNRQMEYCLYMDIDNVIFRSIQRLLNDYYFQFVSNYQRIIEKDSDRFQLHSHRHGKDDANNDIEMTKTGTTTIKYDHPKPRLHFVSMWKDILNDTLWQTGQILYHRHYSQGCMEIWRDQIDSEDNYGVDIEQPLLVKALQHQYQGLLMVPPLSDQPITSF